MQRLFAISMLAFATLFLTACGNSDPHEAAVEDVIDVMSDLEATLGKVEDVKSVEKLSSKFESLGERLNTITKEMADLEEPSEERAKELEEKYKPELDELQDKMKAQMTRIKGLGPDVMGAVMNEMEKMEPGEDMPGWMN